MPNSFDYLGRISEEVDAENIWWLETAKDLMKVASERLEM